ncbi:Ig-like domain repeat protein [Cellulomonas sp. URHD0024]|uniref:Ig-like domain repeat protein n=1 Tax=Cellulomonas sp. URHD0024 TaxID=1302620 RepID=UPI00040D5A33|nr:Ig-like domain repeat protein [Cellulomonas sp. URHD0024]
MPDRSSRVSAIALGAAAFVGLSLALPSAAVAATASAVGAPSLAATTSSTTALTGTLVKFEADELTGSVDTSYAILTADGQLHTVDPAAKEAAFANATSGDKVVATVEAIAAPTTTGGDAPDVLAATITPQAAVAVTPGSIPLHLFVVNVADSTQTAANSVSLDAAKTSAADTLAYWVREGRGAFGTADVAASATLTKPGSCGVAAETLWNAASALFPGVSFSGADGNGNHLIVYSAWSCSSKYPYAGLAQVGTSLASGGYIHSVGSMLTVTTHELGHNVSLGHSNLEYPSSTGALTIKEYYAAYGPMAFANNNAGVGPGSLDVSFQARLGTPGTDAAVTTLTPGAEATTTDVTLAPSNGTSGTRAVKFTLPGSTVPYWIEYRAGTGSDANAIYKMLGEGRFPLAGSPVYYSPGVRIYREESGGYTLVNVAKRDGTTIRTSFAAGQSYASPNNRFTVAVNSADGSTAQIKVSLAGASTPTTKTVPKTTVTAATKNLDGSTNVKVAVTAAGTVVDGTVDLFSGTTKLGTGTLSDGSVSIPVDYAFKVGTYPLTAKYTGSAWLAPSTGAGTLTVYGKGSELTATTEGSVWGKAATINAAATVGGAKVPAGAAVTVYNGTARLGGGVTNADGAVAVPLAASLAAGSYTLTVKYAGALEIAPASATVALTVAKATPTVQLTAPTGLVYGKVGSVKVLVTTNGGVPSGIATLYYGDTKIADRPVSAAGATFPIPAATALPVGDAAFSVSYAGTANIDAGTGTGTLPVSRAASTTTSVITALVYGKPATATVTVRGSAAGTVDGNVEIWEGTEKVAGGTLTAGTVAQIATSTIALPATLNVGAHKLSVRYVGNDTFAASSAGDRAVTVAKATATIEVTPSALTFGTAGALTVTVNSTGVVPGGTVQVFKGTVKLGEATLADGQASVTLPATLPAGTNSLTVKYLESTTVKAATKTVPVSVAKAASTVAVTTIENALKGKAATVVVAVTGVDGQTPTGTVRVKVGTVYVSAAKAVTLVGDVWQATIVTTALPAGTMSVEYSGNVNLLGASTATSTVVG